MTQGRISSLYRINPFEFAERRQRLSGSLSLDHMLRLKPLCSADGALGAVQISLEGGQDLEGFPYLKGRCETVLHLSCQRCLGAMDYPISVEFFVSPIKKEQEAHTVPTCYEPVCVAEDDMLSVSDLFEDELILGLPLVAKHDEAVCPVQVSVVVSKE